MSIPQPYDTGLTEEQLAEAFRRALGDMTDEEIEKAIATAISLIPKGLVYRGAYNYFSELPTNAKEGEVYTVKYKGTSGTEPDGNEYAWGEYEGTLQWIPLGVDSYTKKEIDEQRSSIESDILSAKNDIAINRATLGTQKKNLLSVSNGSAIRFFEKAIKPIEAGKYILTFDEIVSTDTDKTSCLCIFSDAFNNQKSNNISLKRGTNIGASVTINDTVTKIRIYASNDWNNSEDDTITVSNAMLRYADITDNTYEEYKPSLQEQIDALVAEIAELKANQTTVSE